MTIDYDNPWIYKDEPFLSENIGEHYGFVYEIENLETNKKYIGKKFFWFQKTRQVKKKKKRYKAESDWKTYYGSAENLQRDIELLGQDKFKRTILFLCTTKGWCTYYEAKKQFDRDCLLSESYYNSWIVCKVRRNFLK